ncbi:hypothetical protein E2986_13608 [Frieseomelitta varia]|uniref:Uncharacterized protein n=1 Tax=Frieseomelitta varia TaxID=561572 RepID=A0A833RFQ3_9HYME|nr:hypothetical protein E2986_13608 [Frieseomelitta varia]
MKRLNVCRIPSYLTNSTYASKIQNIVKEIRIVRKSRSKPICRQITKVVKMTNLRLPMEILYTYNISLIFLFAQGFLLQDLSSSLNHSDTVSLNLNYLRKAFVPEKHFLSQKTSAKILQKLETSTKILQKLETSAKVLQKLESSTKILQKLKTFTKILQKLVTSTKILQKLETSAKVLQKLESSIKILQKLETSTKILQKLETSTKILQKLGISLIKKYAHKFARANTNRMDPSSSDKETGFCKETGTRSRIDYEVFSDVLEFSLYIWSSSWVSFRVASTTRCLATCWNFLFTSGLSRIDYEVFSDVLEFSLYIWSSSWVSFRVASTTRCLATCWNFSLYIWSSSWVSFRVASTTRSLAT